MHLVKHVLGPSYWRFHVPVCLQLGFKVSQLEMKNSNDASVQSLGCFHNVLAHI